jgi:hypothetical protein
MLDIWLSGDNNPIRAGIAKFQRANLQALRVMPKASLEHMVLRLFKASNLPNLCPFHQHNNFSRPLQKDVNLRMQLVFQYKCFG